MPKLVDFPKPVEARCVFLYSVVLTPKANYLALALQGNQEVCALQL
jgi:hypothetical protein